MRLVSVLPHEVTVDDLECIKRATDFSYDDTEPVDVCRLAMDGKAIIWRFEGDEEGEWGIIVTQGITRNGGSELCILQLAGKGLKKNIKFLFGELEEFCKKYDFRWITGTILKPLVQIVKDEVGFEERAVLVVKEIF